MDHIFGNSDDISFGSLQSPRPAPHGEDLASTMPSSRPPRSVSSSTLPTREHTVSPKPRPLITKDTGTSIPSVPPLSRLIAGMKPSFLPREEDVSLTRLVALSNPSDIDPLFLVRQDETTILIGSGFGTVSRTGREYPTFPDMRLIFSEKDRIRAWVLTNPDIDIVRFELILPTLGFPPIYGTREVIAAFRNSIKNQEFLSSCRFFELFADGAASRRIGDIECIIADIGLNPSFGIRAGGVSVGFPHMSIGSSEFGASVTTLCEVGVTSFSWNKDPFVTGEVIAFKTGHMSRNSMKFTFDTFFVDGLSIGVVAGYALGDREQLAENGVLTFTLEEDSRARTIAGHIFIDSRGFVHAYEMMYIHKEILKGIRSTYEKILSENPKIERGELVQGLRREITKYCYLLTGRTPVVMPIVIER